MDRRPRVAAAAFRARPDVLALIVNIARRGGKWGLIKSAAGASKPAAAAVLAQLDACGEDKLAGKLIKELRMPLSAFPQLRRRMKSNALAALLRLPARSVVGAACARDPEALQLLRDHVAHRVALGKTLQPVADAFVVAMEAYVAYVRRWHGRGGRAARGTATDGAAVAADGAAESGTDAVGGVPDAATLQHGCALLREVDACAGRLYRKGGKVTAAGSAPAAAAGASAVVDTSHVLVVERVSDVVAGGDAATGVAGDDAAASDASPSAAEEPAESPSSPADVKVTLLSPTRAGGKRRGSGAAKGRSPAASPAAGPGAGAAGADEPVTVTLPGPIKLDDGPIELAMPAGNLVLLPPASAAGGSSSVDSASSLLPPDTDRAIAFFTELQPAAGDAPAVGARMWRDQAGHLRLRHEAIADVTMLAQLQQCVAAIHASSAVPSDGAAVADCSAVEDADAGLGAPAGLAISACTHLTVPFGSEATSDAGAPATRFVSIGMDCEWAAPVAGSSNTVQDAEAPGDDAAGGAGGGSSSSVCDVMTIAHGDRVWLIDLPALHAETRRAGDAAAIAAAEAALNTAFRAMLSPTAVPPPPSKSSSSSSRRRGPSGAASPAPAAASVPEPAPEVAPSTESAAPTPASAAPHVLLALFGGCQDLTVIVRSYPYLTSLSGAIPAPQWLLERGRFAAPGAPLPAPVPAPLAWVPSGITYVDIQALAARVSKPASAPAPASHAVASAGAGSTAASPSASSVSLIRDGAGLSHVCGAALGGDLNKYWQMSAWAQRPLFPSQREYAALDAYVLSRVLARALAVGQANGTLAQQPQPQQQQPVAGSLSPAASLP